MPRKNYKCSTCKVKHSPPTGKRCSRRTVPQPINGSVTLTSLPDDGSIAHDLEHGFGSERHGYGASVVTSTSEGIDVVQQEL